jgi:hypothetical protein
MARDNLYHGAIFLVCFLNPSAIVTVFATFFSTMGILILLVLMTLTLVLAKFSRVGARRREKVLPPGPPLVPVFGNLHLMPSMDRMHYQ